MSLNSAQRAEMREWLNGCIAKALTKPQTPYTAAVVEALRLSLDRYQERPQLRVIEGGRK